MVGGCVEGGGVTIGGSGSSAPPPVQSPQAPTTVTPGGGAATNRDPGPNCQVRECFTVIDLTDDDVVEALGPVTWSDLEHFEPTVDAHHMEPDGWIVVGLPTNFYATGGTHVEHGDLFGLAASVRFEPQQWTWNFGEGSTLSSATPGGSWRDLGLDEFEETATSHVFTERGDYTITLEIEYRAEYRINGGAWVPVDGTLTVASDPITARALQASTVLVDKNCNQNPNGPGC